MIYGNKHVVFEQVGVDSDAYYWNSQSNTDSDGYLNDYEISDIRNTLSQTILPKLSNELTGELVSTTIQTAKNGKGSTLVSTTDKLFILAIKEMMGNGYGVSAEDNALTRLQYWTTHTGNTRIKYDSQNVARSYWLRSPINNSVNNVNAIDSVGAKANFTVDTSPRRISSCFAW